METSHIIQIKKNEWPQSAKNFLANYDEESNNRFIIAWYNMYLDFLLSSVVFIHMISLK